MTCAWKELLSVLPIWLRREMDKLKASSVQELRLRHGLDAESIADKIKGYVPDKR